MKVCHPATCNLDNEQLAAYRKQWTVDNPVARHVRYETESRRAGNFGTHSDFHVPSVRYLPGTPRPIEQFRERLLQKYGVLSFSILRDRIGGPTISCRNIQKVINSLEFKTTFAEFNQVYNFKKFVCFLRCYS